MRQQEIGSGKNPEELSDLEAETRKKPTIRLEFLRHDAKAKQATAGDRTGDEFVRLTPEGRQHSTIVGKTKNPKPEVALAWSSVRERALESALRQMLAHDERIGPDTALEEIRALLAEEVKFGKREKMTKLLDFDWDGTKEFHDYAYKRFLTDKEALVFLLEESDQKAKEYKDAKSTSYSRAAGNLAVIVQHYAKVFPNWQRVVEQNPDKYREFENEMQRFIGTHQCVLETLLLKVIEKTDGLEAAKRFVASLPDKNGFGLSEGYSVVLSPGSGSPELVFQYKDQEWKVTPEIIDAIIKDRDNLNQEIAQQRKDISD